MGIHKGVKLTDAPKEQTIRARIDAVTAEKLEYLIKSKGVTKSDIIREGIDIQYNAEKR